MRGVLTAIALALGATLVATPLLIRVLKAAGIGQPIHDAVTQHTAKAGTPTMGGLTISLALAVGFAAAHLTLREPPTPTGLLVVLTILGAGVIGAIDDWLKIRRARNLGLREAQKTIMQLALIATFLLVYLGRPDACTRISITHCESLPWDTGPVLWAAFAGVLFWATSNSVNFTDGLEGLLAGSATMTFAAMGLIAFWQFRHPADYGVADALDLTIICGALAAACLGFLWWNGAPSTIFMGDTGSLAIGTAIASLALTMNVALLVPVLGALYVLEGGSSFLQRYWFRATGGKRLFKMAPLHHHFELMGWPESTIVVRFWILAGLVAALGVGIFYADALTRL